MYKLNDILLSDYGILPGRADNSNISVSGILDMPGRIGKTYQSWGDENGVEPYVSAGDIAHEGRNIIFYGLIKAGTKVFAIQRTKELYDLFTSFDDLVTLETSWGSFQVYVKEVVSVDYMADGWAKIKITFREPVVVNSESLPSGTESSAYNIDGVSFAQLGARVSRVTDNFNRPKTKEGKFTSSGFEGYQLTKSDADSLAVSLVFTASDFSELKSSVQKLHKLLKEPGTRTMNVDGTLRECFNVDGFKGSRIRVYGNVAFCEVTFSMLMAMESAQPGIFGFLQSETGEDIVTETGENIEVI